MVATSLPRRVVGVALSLGEEHLLDFVVDAHEPCLGARGAIAKMRGLGLGFPHSFFGCPKLKRKFVSKVHGAFAVFVRHVRGLLQQGHDRPPGVIGRGTGILLPFGVGANGANGTMVPALSGASSYALMALTPPHDDRMCTIVSGAEPAKIWPCDDITTSTAQARRGRVLRL